MFIIVFNQIFPGTKPFYTALFAEEEEEEKIMQQQATNKQTTTTTKKRFLSFSSQRIEILVCFLCVCERERDRERTTDSELQNA
jgi:hypothetical protein